MVNPLEEVALGVGKETPEQPLEPYTSRHDVEFLALQHQLPRILL